MFSQKSERENPYIVGPIKYCYMYIILRKNIGTIMDPPSLWFEQRIPEDTQIRRFTLAYLGTGQLPHGTHNIEAWGSLYHATQYQLCGSSLFCVQPSNLISYRLLSLIPNMATLKEVELQILS